jgi:putative addiction module component (TIGR02574 family)
LAWKMDTNRRVALFGPWGNRTDLWQILPKVSKEAGRRVQEGNAPPGRKRIRTERGRSMKKITATDSLVLSIPERIQLVEDIWDTIAAKADSVELTEEEKRIVDDRLEAYHRNPDAGSPWKDVFKRITNRQWNIQSWSGLRLKVI